MVTLLTWLGASAEEVRLARATQDDHFSSLERIVQHFTAQVRRMLAFGASRHCSATGCNWECTAMRTPHTSALPHKCVCTLHSGLHSGSMFPAWFSLSLCISFFAFRGVPGQRVFHEADGHCYVEPDVVEDVPGGLTPAEYTARLDAEAHAAAAAGTPGEVFLFARGPTVHVPGRLTPSPFLSCLNSQHPTPALRDCYRQPDISRCCSRRGSCCHL